MRPLCSRRRPEFRVALSELPGYGTHASQIVMLYRDGYMLLAERHFDANAGQVGEARLVASRG